MRLSSGIVALAIAAVSCGDDKAASEPGAPTGPANASARPAAKPGDKVTPGGKPAAPPYSYSPVGKRDPFRSYLAELSEERGKETQRKKEDTEKFELDQYRLTGIITATAQPRAMVEDPTGRGHVLHIGSRLGKNGGRVTRISETGIVVTEEFRAPTGERVRVPITIKLPRKEAEPPGEP